MHLSMKYTYLILIFLVTTTLISCKKDKSEPTNTSSNEYNPGTGWNLSWSEEFEGTSLTTSTWNYDLGTGTYGWGNAELQYYRSENVQVADGKLVITAKRENYSSSYFTSGRINTKNKYSFKYGKVVGKIKVPQGYGMWPAFWMLGSSAQTWPACGEIDIMEIRGGEDKATTSTLHWQDTNNAHKYYGQSYNHTTNLANDYHYYEVEWNENKIISRFDGIQYNEMNITAAEVSELRDNSYFIILNVAVGGNFFSPAITNQADVTAAFPQSMTVDWVRVYQK
jgi:beta-glucanase (GH16 family)